MTISYGRKFCDSQAEFVVLSYCLGNPRDWIGHDLRPEHFYVKDYALLWDAIVRARSEGCFLDYRTAKLWATNCDHPFAEDFIDKLIDVTFAKSNAEEAVHYIIDLAAKNDIFHLGQQVQNIASKSEPDEPARVLLEKMENELAALRKEYGYNSAGWMSAKNIEPANIEWLWPNRIIANRINIVAGMGDVGKDVFCCYVAACVTTGRDWPDGAKGCEPGLVGIISPEDEPENTIIPRLIAAGADLSKVKIWTPSNPPKPADIIGLKLLIVSPLINLMDGQKEMNREQDAREFLALWQSAGKSVGCTVLGTAHYSKKSDAKVAQRILGASGMINFVRMVWSIQRDDEDPTVRLFMRLKANLTPDEVGGLKFTITHVGPWSQSIVATWCGTTDKTPDAVMSAVVSQKKNAGKWLTEYLQRHGGMAEVNVIIEAAEKDGYSKDSMRQAQRRDTRILAAKHGFGDKGRWWWKLSNLDGKYKIDGL